jgi:hypothetical protein
LDLADQIGTELLVAYLVQSFEGCSVLIVAEATGLAVNGPAACSDGKEGGNVGNTLREKALVAGNSAVVDVAGIARQTCSTASLTNSGSSLVNLREPRLWPV